MQPTIYAQVAGNEAIVSMVSLGFGVGVVPKIVLDNSPLADRVRALFFDSPALAMGSVVSYRGAEIEIDMLKKVRLEIAVNDEFVDATTEAIIRGATATSSRGRVTRRNDCMPVAPSTRAASSTSGSTARKPARAARM